MKKLKKVKTNLQDSIEAYDGVCNCAMTCPQIFCDCMGNKVEASGKSSEEYAALESNCLSIVNSHYSWA